MYNLARGSITSPSRKATVDRIKRWTKKRYPMAHSLISSIGKNNNRWTKRRQSNTTALTTPPPPQKKKQKNAKRRCAQILPITFSQGRSRHDVSATLCEFAKKIYDNNNGAFVEAICFPWTEVAETSCLIVTTISPSVSHKTFSYPKLRQEAPSQPYPVCSDEGRTLETAATPLTWLL